VHRHDQLVTARHQRLRKRSLSRKQRTPSLHASCKSPCHRNRHNLDQRGLPHAHSRTPLLKLNLSSHPLPRPSGLLKELCRRQDRSLRTLPWVSCDRHMQRQLHQLYDKLRQPQRLPQLPTRPGLHKRSDTCYEVCVDC
jgi:hypothetical protein